MAFLQVIANGSVNVWQEQEKFLLDENGNLQVAAGRLFVFTLVSKAFVVLKSPPRQLGGDVYLKQLVLCSGQNGCFFFVHGVEHDLETHGDHNHNAGKNPNGGHIGFKQGVE